MKCYELRFLNAQGGTLLAYLGEFTDDNHAREKLLSMKGIPCDRAELWCGDNLIHRERNGPKPDAPSGGASA